MSNFNGCSFYTFHSFRNRAALPIVTQWCAEACEHVAVNHCAAWVPYTVNLSSIVPCCCFTQLPAPETDRFGRALVDCTLDRWPARSGVALALSELAPLLPQSELLRTFSFYVERALGDRSWQVRSEMREAALAAVNCHGKVGGVVST